MSPALGSTARRIVIGFLAVTAVAACVPDPGTTPTTTSTTTSTTSTTTTTQAPVVLPDITSFTATRTSGAIPLTTVFSWTISDPNGAPLTCELDANADGTYETTIAPCTSDSTSAATINAIGPNQATLRVSNGTYIRLAQVLIYADLPGSDLFDLDLRVLGTITPSQQALFDAVTARIESIVGAGLPDTNVNAVAGGSCGGQGYSGPVDDLVVNVTFNPGEFGVAAPCGFRFTTSGPNNAYCHVILGGPDDLADLEAAGQLDDLLLHELLHCLGIGSDGRWYTSILNLRSPDPRFVGPTAVAEWHALGGTGGVPVTVESALFVGGDHWSEDALGDELMTPTIGAGNQPLSRVTIAALADIGYAVNLDLADPYSLP